MCAMQNKQQHEWGIDLLRMLSMFFVVVLHILGNGGVLVNAAPGSMTYWTAWFWEIAAYCAVNCFAIISGFVMAGRKVKPHKLLSLWLQVFLYSICITQLVVMLKPGTLTRWDRLASFFPVLGNQYWYFTAYVMMFLLLPVLEPGIAVLSKKQHGMLLVSLLGIAAGTRFLESCIFYGNPALTGDPYFRNGYSFVWLTVLYLLGSFMHKYVRKEKIHVSAVLGVYLGCVFLTWFWKFSMETIFHKPEYSELWVSYLSPTIVGAAISLFLLFWKFEIHNSWLTKIVRRMAPLAFSVYLIHTTPAAFTVMMQNAFVGLAEMPAWKMTTWVLLLASGIYLLCSGIDVIRCWLFRVLRVDEGCLHCEKMLSCTADRFVDRL